MKNVSSTSPPSRQHRRRAALVSASLLAFCFLSGCAAPDAHVAALPKAEAENALTYHFTPPVQLAADARHYREATQRVRTALASRGMQEAPAGERPDVLVALELDIGPPTKTWEKRAKPEYVEMPGQIRTETRFTGTDKDGNPVMEQISVQDPPTQRYVGTDRFEVAVMTYEKRLRLTACPNAAATEGSSPAEIWAVEVKSHGRTKDLSRVLPRMVAATVDYIGKDARGQRTLKLRD